MAKSAAKTATFSFTGMVSDVHAVEPNICLEVDGDYTHANPRPYLRPHKSPKMESGHKPDDIINTKTAKSIWEKDRKITKALIQLDNAFSASPNILAMS